MNQKSVKNIGLFLALTLEYFMIFQIHFWKRVDINDCSYKET